MKILSRITEELEAYTNGTVDLFDEVPFSAFRLIRRINLYKNQIYPSGKFDSQGSYKFWFDIISPRVDSEVKNIDFDTKDIVLMSDAIEDSGRLLIANASLGDYLRSTGQAAKLNEAIERGTEWGNVVWKKIKNDYILMELSKVKVLNQTAETLEDSDVIEEEIMTPIDMRAKADVWDMADDQGKKNVDKLIDSGKKEHNKTAPEFFIYERNGEITEQEFNEAKGLDDGDEQKYMLVKVIVGGTTKDDPTEILFIETITKKPYKEYHRGKYSGRWIRVGMYEVLFDVQTRSNEIGNQIAKGLEWASKKIFTTPDKVIANNILTDMQNGDVIKTAGLTSVDTGMEGFDQLAADWNRMMEIADRLSNSFEIVTGETLPSGTPLRLGALQNQNANKHFDFLREKLGVAFQDVIGDWVLPGLLKDLNAKKILKLTADGGYLTRYYELLVESWYVRNLAFIGPHTSEIAADIKEEKLQELLNNDEIQINLGKDMWKGFKPRAIVVITGENVNIISDLETLQTFIALEADPIRRTALIEIAMKKKGMDVDKLPKTPPQPIQEQPAPQQTNQRVEATV